MLRHWTVAVLLPLLLCGGLAAAPVATNARLPWLGIKFRWIKDHRGQRIQHVERVTAGGPAARAGLRSGDLILTIAERAVGFGDDLDYLLYLADRTPGERLNLRILREGRPGTLQIVVGIMPESARPGWNAAVAQAKLARIKAASRE